MEDRQANSTVNARKRRLLVALMAFSVGGCATSRDAVQGDLSHSGQPPRSVAASGDVADTQSESKHSAWHTFRHHFAS